jgi:glycosyltransferase involved in cell wall biosynthesis
MKVLHIITGLNNGGAEGVLYRLCKFENGVEHVVVSLLGEGKYGHLLRRAGIEVHYLNMSKGIGLFKSLWTLYRLLLRNNPDLVQTWMYHADLIGGIVARFAGVKSILWNVRHSTLEPGKSKRSTRVVAKICALLSGWIPKKIVYCAFESKNVHEKLGYKMHHAVVIPNGYDLTQFVVNDSARMLMRAEIDVSDDDLVIGMVGRFDPQKDHQTLLKAAALLKEKLPSFKLVLVGNGLNDSNYELNDRIKKYNLKGNVCLLDQRSDIAYIMNGLDVHVLSSSSGEGFPNVVAEAMACGTPCITTDVGDAAVIVGNTGWVVPPDTPQALTDAILSAAAEKQYKSEAWAERKLVSRNHIIHSFSLEKMCEKYLSTWSG